jgi:hypothetical protein
VAGCGVAAAGFGVAAAGETVCSLGLTVSLAPARSRDHARDQLRTARLLFDAELIAGVVGEAQLDLAEVRAATRVAAVPPRPLRLSQQVLHKLGRLSCEREITAPLLAARRAVLGEGAACPPRLLVRVDEFPHYRAWDEPGRYGTAAFERFHEIMAAAGVPYLIAALPRLSREPLSAAPLGSRPLAQDELELLRRLRGEGVALAVHGLDHRTRHRAARRRSELCGLSAERTERLLEAALSELAGAGAPPEVFVAPYNRFDAAQLEPLARRFAVVGGGPESIGTLGFQRPPQWRGEAVYLPSYPPFYGRAADVLPAVERAIDRATGLWTPIVLHWGWEADAGWEALERLAARIASVATPWQDFLAAVARSREGPRTAAR